MNKLLDMKIPSLNAWTIGDEMSELCFHFTVLYTEDFFFVIYTFLA